MNPPPIPAAQQASIPLPPAYNTRIEEFREEEYPMLKGNTYLDHGGTTLYAKSLVDRFSRDLISNLYGNPHSASTPSTLAGDRVNEIRIRALQFFNADPNQFDLIFVANATAAIKLVADCFRDYQSPTENIKKTKGFWYGYHRDAHTSLVGVRETTNSTHRCFGSDDEVHRWIDGSENSAKSKLGPRKGQVGLFAFPGQSNMTGRRLPLTWPGRLRAKYGDNMYSLLDAAALATTCPIDLSNDSMAPDFTCVSFYKIFGFPNVGALIVRKNAGHMLERRKFFGGGTVDMVISLDSAWHALKDSSLHDRLEDGTLPFHSIVALGHALDLHPQLYESMSRISAHTAFLAKQLYNGIKSLTHSNGVPVCRIYKDPEAVYGDPNTQGATIAFNIQGPDGVLVRFTDVEKLADDNGIYIRAGGLCNPGGIATFLEFTRSDLHAAFSIGHRCSNPLVVTQGRATGVVRVSLGAMSTLSDVDTLLIFLRENYVVDIPIPAAQLCTNCSAASFYLQKNARTSTSSVLTRRTTKKWARNFSKFATTKKRIESAP